MQQEIELLDQIIEMERHRDSELDKYYKSIHQSFKTVGESSCTHHLKTLREMLESRNKSPEDFKNYFTPINGCIGTRYCHTCHIIWGGTCLCTPVPCPICNGNCPSESSDNTDNWERKSRDQFVVDSKGL